MHSLTIDIDGLPKGHAREAVNQQALRASQDPVLWPAAQALRASLMGEIDALPDGHTVTLIAAIDVSLLSEAPAAAEPKEADEKDEE